MVMEKSRSKLESLSRLAPQLNKATDLYMDELKEIEAQLNNLNLGVSVEIDGCFKAGSSHNRYDRDDEVIGAYHTAWALRYGKTLRGGWGILVTEYVVDEETNKWVERSEIPLLNASRDLRIAAAERIPELLETIEREVNKKIETLEAVSDKR